MPFWATLILLSAIGCNSVADSMVGNFRTEPEWCRQIATERGLDPNQVCEYRLPNGSRVDILTETHAIEVEWVYKHEEAIGQSIFYAMATNRKPAIILLLKGEPSEDEDYLICLGVCNAIRFNGEPIRLEAYKVPK